MGGRPGDALALGQERRAFLLRGLTGGGRDRADRRKTLAKFVMQLAREMLPFLVLDHDQPLRQRFAFRKRRLKAAGQVVEHIANCRKLGEIEGRQTRREIAGGKALKTRADRPGRPQGVGERRVNQHAKSGQSDGHDDGEATGLPPALSDQALAIDRRHGLTVRLRAEAHGARRLAARIEKALVQIGEELRRAGIVGRGAAAQALKNFATLGAIGDAQAGRHDRRRDPFQIRELLGRPPDPVALALLQCEVLGDHVGDPIRPRPRRAVGLEQNISRGGGETERRQSDDAQEQPKFQIELGRWHGRNTFAKGLRSTARAGSNLEAEPAFWKYSLKDRAICPAIAGMRSLSDSPAIRAI